MGRERGEYNPQSNQAPHSSRIGEFHRGVDRPLFADLDTADLANGIEDGSITDTQAVRVLVRKEYDWHRQLHRGESLKELQERYEPLLSGSANELAGYCQRKADRYMSLGYEVPHHDITDYGAAARWYDMAARLSHEAARTEPQGRKLPPVPTGEMLQAINQPSEHMVRSYQALENAQTIAAGIESGTMTDTAAVHELVSWQLEMQRARPRTLVPEVEQWAEEEKAGFAHLVYGDPKDMVAFCLSEAVPQRSGMHRDDEAAANWYAPKAVRAPPPAPLSCPTPA